MALARCTHIGIHHSKKGSKKLILLLRTQTARSSPSSSIYPATTQTRQPSTLQGL